MKQHRDYRSLIAQIERELTLENKAYMGKINGYMALYALLSRQEEAVNEQLLAIYQDVREAQREGQSAQDFIGKDSKAMADQLLINLPAIDRRELLGFALRIFFYFISSQFVVTFAGEGQIPLNWLDLLWGGLVSCLFPFVLLRALRGLIYQTNPYKIWGTYGGLSLGFTALLACRHWLLSTPPHLVLKGWEVAPLLMVIGCFLFVRRKDTLIRLVFLPLYILSVGAGFLSLMGDTPIWWSVLVGLFMLGLVLYQTHLLLKKKED